MIEAAEVLAKDEVRTAIKDLIVDAATGYGVKLQHAREMADRFVAPIELGRPVMPAIALVDAIQLNTHETDDEEDDEEGICAHGIPFDETCEECDLEDLEDEDVDG